MDSITFLQLAEKVIKEEKKPLTANEIWKIAETKGYTSLLNSSGKTPWDTLNAQLYVNVKNINQSKFRVIGQRPKRFYLLEFENEYELSVEDNENTDENIPDSKPKYLERDLHSFLSYFAYYKLENCLTKTINHSKSNKKEYGKWVHPDIVGCKFPIQDWSSEVLKISQTVGNNSLILYSFELKRSLNLSNLRESFFQCVSNSSWANESYLVAAEVSNNADFRSELKRLSSSFGIGIIGLDISNPDNSEIIYSAKRRDSLDWETINKLTINTDFKEFLNRIEVDIRSNETRNERYDTIHTVEELLNSINE